MKTKTKISVEDGSYTSPAHLTIDIEVPRVISGGMQARLRRAIAEIQHVYCFYRPGDNRDGKA